MNQAIKQWREDLQKGLSANIKKLIEVKHLKISLVGQSVTVSLAGPGVVHVTILSDVENSSLILKANINFEDEDKLFFMDAYEDLDQWAGILGKPLTPVTRATVRILRAIYQVAISIYKRSCEHAIGVAVANNRAIEADVDTDGLIYYH